MYLIDATVSMSPTPSHHLLHYAFRTLDSFEADCLGHDYFILEKGVGEVRQHGFHYQALLEEWKKIEASNPSVASVAPSRSVTSPTTPPLTPVAHSSTALPSSPSSSSRPSITPLRIDPEPPHFYGRHSNDGDFYSRGLWVHHGSEGSRYVWMLTPAHQQPYVSHTAI